MDYNKGKDVVEVRRGNPVFPVTALILHVLMFISWFVDTMSVYGATAFNSMTESRSFSSLYSEEPDLTGLNYFMMGIMALSILIFIWYTMSRRKPVGALIINFLAAGFYLLLLISSVIIANNQVRSQVNEMVSAGAGYTTFGYATIIISGILLVLIPALMISGRSINRHNRGIR